MNIEYRDQYTLVAEEVANKLNKFGFKEAATVVTPLETFLRGLSQTEGGPFAIGLVFRDFTGIQGYPRPLLDAYLRCPGASGGNPQQEGTIERAGELHDTLAISLARKLDNFLHVVDKNRYPTIDEFRATVIGWAQETPRNSLLLACIEIEQSTPV